MMREDDVTNATNDETIAKGAKKASNDSPASEHWDLGERSTNEEVSRQLNNILPIVRPVQA